MIPFKKHDEVQIVCIIKTRQPFEKGMLCSQANRRAPYHPRKEQLSAKGPGKLGRAARWLRSVLWHVPFLLQIITVVFTVAPIVTAATDRAKFTAMVLVRHVYFWNLLQGRHDSHLQELNTFPEVANKRCSQDLNPRSATPNQVFFTSTPQGQSLGTVMWIVWGEGSRDFFIWAH